MAPNLSSSRRRGCRNHYLIFARITRQYLEWCVEIMPLKFMTVVAFTINRLGLLASKSSSSKGSSLHSHIQRPLKSQNAGFKYRKNYDESKHSKRKETQSGSPSALGSTVSSIGHHRSMNVSRNSCPTTVSITHMSMLSAFPTEFNCPQFL